MIPNRPNTDITASRRDFLKASTTAVAAGALASELAFPAVVSAQANSDTLRIGFIGCGGRGTGAAAQALSADSNVVLHAMADVYEASLDRSLASVSKSVGDASKFDVPKTRQFVGLDGYEKVLKSGVDVVILTTPPGFRPLHFQAAVDAGKHVFLEKPMGTDAVGCRQIMATAEEARKKNLSVVDGFCWRYNYARRELYKRVHDGVIGDIRAIYATYLTGPVKPMPAKETRPEGMSDTEWQVRNWYNFTWLSGDGLVEQAIHSVDKIAWAMKDEPPVECTAVGGRQIPNHEGNIWDHIEVNYEWKNGVRAFMAQRQTTGCYNENFDYILGTKGSACITRAVYIQDLDGKVTWRHEGNVPDMYQVEHNEMYAAIRQGRPMNSGVRMCQSTLMGIMGRMAGYTGQKVSWEHLMKSQERQCPVELAQLDWKAPLPITPIAMPGRTKLV
jgi:predicted dehydrogenase